MVDWGKKGNPFLDAVQAMSITGEEAGGRELTPEERELEEMRGPKVADRWEDDPRHPKNRKTDFVEVDGDMLPRWLVEGDDVAGQNAPGSYEALLRGWGGDTRKAFDNELVR